MSRVMTVLGEKPPEQLGLTDAHNHIWIDPVPGCAPGAPVLDQWAPAVDELRAFVRAGGGTVLDCQPAGCGRNALKLVELSRASGVMIVACTGFHRSIYYPQDYWLWGGQSDRIADHFIMELRTGLQETLDQDSPVRAGFIKIACEETLKQTCQPALEASAFAAVETGCALEIHTEKGADAESIAGFFLDRGVRAGQIILCHMDKRPVESLHRSLAISGLTLEYDTFYRPKYQPERFLWPLIAFMAAEGLDTRVVLATDMAEAAMWSGNGGPGLANFPLQIRQRLIELGLDASTINNLMGANIGRCLAQNSF